MEKPKHTTELCDQITDEIDLALAENQMVLKGLGFVVHEIHRPMQHTERDTFIDDLIADPNQGALFND